MKICYLAPHLHRPHGGIRVIIEHVNTLAALGHDCTLHVFGNPMNKVWATISSQVRVLYGGQVADEFDVIVSTTPPLALMLDAAAVGAKKFYFLQMAENLFVQSAHDFNQKAMLSYRVPFPIIGISRWVEFYVRTTGGRKDMPMYYVGNGVSADFCPPKQKPEQFTVLVEGWQSYGDSKDVAGIAPNVAKRLKQEFGAYVIAYSQFPLTHMKDVPDEYYQIPAPDELVSIYQRAHIMLKASLLDARSCAPVEAMACGCVPVRAIQHGDDDLIHGYNCLRSEYNEGSMYRNAAQLIKDRDMLNQLAHNGLEYRKEWLDWREWMKIIEQIYAAHE